MSKVDYRTITSKQVIDVYEHLINIISDLKINNHSVINTTDCIDELINLQDEFIGLYGEEFFKTYYSNHKTKQR